MSEWKRCECGSVEIVWPATEVETTRAMHRLKKYGACESKPQSPDLRDAEIATLRASLAASEARVAEIESQGRALADIAMQTKAQRDEIEAVLRVSQGLVAFNRDRRLALESQRDAAQARVRVLEGFVQDFAGEPCAYGDGCPPFGGTHHGTCHPCRARAALGGSAKEGT